MELEGRQAPLVRMDEQDRISQASSVATISYFPVIRQESDGKVQTFGKRCQAAKRDPNCLVVIRGWLNKKDSAGLKLWKRRWFVLSNYCLFYYKDSREESVMGSIPLPSYKILFCTPRECKNRKFTFKVVHQGMRTYYFSADTQEDMLGWVRALSQSASMETDSSMSRRCSSYQDFTQMGGSSESVDLPKSPSDGEGLSQNPRHVSRTLSEPSQLRGGRIGTSSTEQRGRRSGHQKNRSPSARTPSPWGPNREGDSLPFSSDHIEAPTQAETIGTGPSTSRGQLGSRPHTPVGRVDIRPQDDLFIVPDTLYYTPVSPKMDFKSNSSTPLTERWQNVKKPTPTYGSVHHVPNGRRPPGKSYSTGAHTDLLPPLPPSSRAAQVHHLPHHHHPPCSVPAVHVPPKSEPTPSIRLIESDADAVLTRLCGCDKLLQSLSVELSHLQMDKDSVQCALEVLRLQLEDWNSQGPRAQEEALTQKALLQEELVTIRARMCDVSLEMERVWSQYERMESELSVFRSHLQHICNFGLPQEQSQAQRELWMMEDILAGLKVNRDHFHFLLRLQRHHMFESSGPHPGSPGSPKEMPHGLPINVEEQPPVRPPLPQELQESIQSRNQDRGWTESSYEGIYSLTDHKRGKCQPDLRNVKAHKDVTACQSNTKWITADATAQSTKKMKMSEEEQMERMKRNQERMTNRKKPPIPSAAARSQSQSLETQEEAPFPIRMTRVITAVLPSSLVARRVSVEDPPPELSTPLPEQVSPDFQSKKNRPSSRPTRRLLLPESADQGSEERCLAMKAERLASRSTKLESAAVMETSRMHVCHPADGSISSEMKADEQTSALLTSDMAPDLCMTPEQREAKLRRVERIRQRVIHSAVRESATSQIKEEGLLHDSHDTSGKQRSTSDHDSTCHLKTFKSSLSYVPADPTSRNEDKQNAHVDNVNSPLKFGSRTQHKSHTRRAGVATKIKRPPSPHHITSMTFYQTDGGKGFVNYKDEEQQQTHEPDGGDGDDEERSISSCDLRSKWFLSTNHHHEFLPLHIPDIDFCSEGTGKEDQPVCLDDCNLMSSTVSQSLEKMKENHSLFYKIACDISISDTDITKNDSCISPQLGNEEELFITECMVGRTSDQERKDLIQGLPDENSHSNEDKVTTEEVLKLNSKESRSPDQALECDREENGGTKEPEERGEENQETNNGVSRRASFQKAKVTVLRTSL
ncbi:pleckstrin homology domain-containing family A member 7 isoform X3 [Dunckerocampus dactyliophorus]|uniref:pleckstrin homology domain-containing family A member 7 isoform X3 n=1 Tax=Dunckerocampus dactyliophorus TaxID=161453 RepID=UPI002406B519|nr:pleckstrin homology domain-containing family A member 7 isoform X3 [Dunckerocampus dactyliophorus]